MSKRHNDSDNDLKRGPKPERVKIDVNWEEAVDKAMKKKRPADGWPEPEKKEEKK